MRDATALWAEADEAVSLRHGDLVVVQFIAFAEPVEVQLCCRWAVVDG